MQKKCLQDQNDSSLSDTKGIKDVLWGYFYSGRASVHIMCLHLLISSPLFHLVYSWTAHVSACESLFPPLTSRTVAILPLLKIAVPGGGKKGPSLSKFKQIVTNMLQMNTNGD